MGKKRRNHVTRRAETSIKSQPQVSRVRTETAIQHVPCQRLLGSTRWSAPSSLVGISQPEEDPLKFRLNLRPLELVGSCANASYSRLRHVIVLLNTLEEMRSEDALFCRDAWGTDCSSETLRSNVSSPSSLSVNLSTSPRKSSGLALRDLDGGAKVLGSGAS